MDEHDLICGAKCLARRAAGALCHSAGYDCQRASFAALQHERLRHQLSRLINERVEMHAQGLRETNVRSQARALSRFLISASAAMQNAQIADGACELPASSHPHPVESESLFFVPALVPPALEMTPASVPPEPPLVADVPPPPAPPVLLSSDASETG
jgi:hypothetical protein